MKYIDADKLIAKIKELNLVTKTYEEQVAFNNALAMVVEIIRSLHQEQQEIDLEKDVESWFFNGNSSKINVEHTMYYYFQECARRYFELGKNSK